MVKTEIKIDSYSDEDYEERYHGKAIDQSLSWIFWINQTHKVIGHKARRIVHVEEVDLSEGYHFITYYTPAHIYREWIAKIFVNGELIAEGKVCYGRMLYGWFEVKAPPAPIEWLPMIIGAGAPILFGVAVITYTELTKK